MLLLEGLSQVVAVADPANEICPECGRPVGGVFKCVINGFYHDTVIVHIELVRVALPYGIVNFPVPRFCGPAVLPHARVDVDMASKVIRITQ